MGGCCSAHSTKRASATAGRRPGATMADEADAADSSLSVTHQTRFALRLATALLSSSSASAAAATNVAFSPLSLHVVLSLLTAGAKGSTRDQLVATLGGGAGAAVDLHALAGKMVQLVLTDGSRGGGPRVAFANGVFVDSALKINRAFDEVAVGKYKAETRSVDFQKQAVEAAGQVNSWVEKVTSGLIKEILPPRSVDQTTALVLCNALYFKGFWAQKFDAFETKDGQFHLVDGSSVQTPFMASTKDQYISSYDDVKVLKLPYRQGRDKKQFSMYILLPQKQDGVWTLAENLTSEPEFLENHIPEWKFPVGEFKVPKFKISFGFEASDLLKGLGLELPFSAEADLSELFDSPFKQNLCVSSIFHKSFVEVNEEGTKAAAASSVEVMVCGNPRPVDFIADHPFLFLIREDTSGVVLFVGLVANPLIAA